jgi:hypothetical protein
MLFEPKDIGLKYRVQDHKYFEGKLIINNWPRDFFYADGLRVKAQVWLTKVIMNLLILC